MCVTCQGKETQLSSALLEEGCVHNPNPIESKVAKLMHIHACLGKLIYTEKSLILYSL